MAKIALLIGVSEYEPGLNPLPAAVKDLDAMREVLLHPDIGGFAESDIMLLKNPKRQEMEESIETLFANRHKDDLVLLFFSGHGIKDDAGRLYLGTRKTRKTPQGDLVRSSAVAANFVHENMSRSRSKRQVVILDSCFSGAFAEGLSAKDDGTVDIRTQLGGEGRAVLTSSSSTQYSFEQEGEELSLYTRFLIEGIKTGAADLDGDDVVSIDELHEYASRKVREVKPELKPEIYAMREGFKIRLSKVPQGDPRQKYQKEVTRCGKRGELTIVSRSILDTWRLKLGLAVDEAKALEDEVLEPYRRDFQQKLQQYEQTVTEVLQRDGSISDSTRHELQQLQQVLELRKEDTVPIEARITAHLKTHKQNLETYKQSFSEALWQEHPLTESSCSRLQQMRQQLALSDADVALIEAQMTTEAEIYRRNLQQYEQAFLMATQQDYPLSESKRAELRQHQLSLGLSDVEIAPIEAKVTTQIETYHQKLRQYEEAFASATQRKHQPGEANRTQLRQTWQTLGLHETDVKAIEAPILAQIETYQSHLRLYEQAFVNATEQEYPFSEAKRSELRQRQQALSLSNEDIEPIENHITASIEDRLKKFQQYEQVFSDSIQFEFPVSEATREELRRFQHVLELRDKEVAQLEEKVASQNKRSQNQNQQADTSQTVPQPIEVDAQETQNLQVLQAYEVEVAKWIRYGISLKDYVVREQLDSLRDMLELSSHEAEAIEVRLTGGTQPPNTHQDSNTTVNQDVEAIQHRLKQHSPTRKNRKAPFLVVGTIAASLGMGILSHIFISRTNTPQLSPVPLKTLEPRVNDGLTSEKDAIGTSYLGVQMVNLTPSLRREINQRKQNFQVSQDTGVLVLEVYKDSPAFLAGIQLGDIIQKINGEEVKTYEKLLEKLESTSIGEVVKIEIKRGITVRTLEVKLGKMPKWLSLQNSGISKQNRGDYQGALQDYDEAIRLNPERTDAYVSRGNTKFALNDNKGAIADYDEAIRLKPAFTDAYIGRGNVKFDLGDQKGAITDYDEAIRLNPEGSDAYINRGNAKYKLGKKEEALADYNEAIRINPSLANAYVGRGNVKLDLGDKKGAITDYDEAIRLSPDYATTYFNRANAKLNLQDKKGAIADYSEAIRLNPEYANAYFNRASTKLALGEKQGAIIDYQDAARLYQKKGDIESYQKSIYFIEKIQK